MLFKPSYSAKLIITYKDPQKRPLETDFEYGNFASTIIDLMHTYYKSHNLEWRHEASIVTLKTTDEIQTYTEKYKELVEWTEFIRLYYKDCIGELALHQFENLCNLGSFSKGFSQLLFEGNRTIYGYEIAELDSALMPTHLRLHSWSSTLRKEDADKYFDTFKNYILETMQCKRFFGVPTQEIETVTMKLC